MAGSPTSPPPVGGLDQSAGLGGRDEPVEPRTVEQIKNQW